MQLLDNLWDPSKTRRSRLKPTTVRTLGMVAGALLATSCGKSIDVATWKEEVLLHDGRMLVIERIAKANRQGFLSDSRGSDIEFEIKYEPMKVNWKGTLQQGTFEIFDGVAYVVTTVGDQVKFCKGKPPSTLPITVLKQHGDDWIRIDTNDFPADRALRNLYRGYWGNSPREDASGLVTWDVKTKRDGYPTTEGSVGGPKRAYTVAEFYRNEGLTCARFQTTN